MASDRASTTRRSLVATMATLPALAGYLPIGANAQVRATRDDVRDRITPAQFGAVGDGVANDNAAMQLALEAVAASGATLDLIGLTYVLNASRGPNPINFARSGLHIRGGGATLKFVGAGQAFVMDVGGTSGDHVGGIFVEDVIIEGGSGTADGFYSAGIVRSFFRNIEVRNVIGKAFHIKHGVSNQYDGLKYSTNDVAQNRTPTHGLYLGSNGDFRGRPYYTANCTFINPVMEGFRGSGCTIADQSSGNLFIGGTFEGLATGVRVEEGSSRNSFKGIWFEANTQQDAEIYGDLTAFDDCHFQSSTANLNVLLQSSSRQTQFRGGFIRAVDVDAASMHNLFLGCALPDHNTVGFQGRGAYKRIGCTQVSIGNAVTGSWHDIVGDSGRFTPILTAGRGRITLNAANTGGTYQRLGDRVRGSLNVEVSGVRSPSGQLSITGLPFTPRAGVEGYAAVTVAGWGLEVAAKASLIAFTSGGIAAIFIDKFEDGAQSVMAADVKAGTVLNLSFDYAI